MNTIFTSVPLVQVVKEIGFLEGDLGREFLREYNARAERDYGQTRVGHNLGDALYMWDDKAKEWSDGAKHIVEIDRDVVVGTSPFATILAYMVLREGGLRTATRDEIIEGIYSGMGKLAGGSWYTYGGLVLRSEDNPHSYLAADLAAQLRARSYRLDYPLLIHFKDLSLRHDDNAPDGLALNLNENIDLVCDPTLNRVSEFDHDVDVKLSGLFPYMIDQDPCEYKYPYNDNGERSLTISGNEGGRVVIVKVLPTPVPVAIEGQLKNYPTWYQPLVGISHNTHN